MRRDEIGDITRQLQRLSIRQQELVAEQRALLDRLEQLTEPAPPTIARAEPVTVASTPAPTGDGQTTFVVGDYVFIRNNVTHMRNPTPRDTLGRVYRVTKSRVCFETFNGFRTNCASSNLGLLPPSQLEQILASPSPQAL